MTCGPKQKPKHLLRKRLHITLTPVDVRRLTQLCKQLEMSQGDAIGYLLRRDL